MIILITGRQANIGWALSEHDRSERREYLQGEFTIYLNLMDYIFEIFNKITERIDA